MYGRYSKLYIWFDLKKWRVEDDYVGIGNWILGYRDYEDSKANARKENYIIRV